MTPPGWPGNLVDPNSPEFENQSIQWILDRLPSVFRSVSCKSDPVALVWVLENLVEAQVTALRQLNAIARTQSDVTDITMLMDAIAQAESASVRTHRETELVRAALAVVRGRNSQSLLD